ncbi:MAG TPA: hypothetical protein DEA52_06845 [Clostridiaceae bacterium]|nr:hypothetical protein [Clostridiaceae bacterium]
MEDKKKGVKLAKGLGKFTSEVMQVSGDALGLLAMKMGKEAIAYKTIQTMRRKGDETGDQVERFLEKNIQKVQVVMAEQDLKGKAESTLEDVKEAVKKVDLQKIRQNLKDKADGIITKETKIYGDPQHFYDKEKEVEGIILEEVSWKEGDL